MKRIYSIAFCVLMVCSLMLVVTAHAGNAAFSITEYFAASPHVLDGKWTTPDEWNDAQNTPLLGNTSGGFAYNVQDMTNYGVQWVVEIFSDNTNNTGDYVQICIDDSNAGGTAPKTGQYMIEIDGHTTLKCYQGNGTGWARITPDAGEITFATTLGTSRWWNQTHWIIEVVDSSKTAGQLQIPNAPPTGMLIAAFDAATNLYCSWGTGGTANKPDSWGLVSTYDTSGGIPEGFSLGAVMLVTSVAAIIGYYLVRKQQKPAFITQKNL